MVNQQPWIKMLLFQISKCNIKIATHVIVEFLHVPYAPLLLLTMYAPGGRGYLVLITKTPHVIAPPKTGKLRGSLQYGHPPKKGPSPPQWVDHIPCRAKRARCHPNISLGLLSRKITSTGDNVPPERTLGEN